MNADTSRRLENLIRLGRIDSVTPAEPFHTVTVNLGDIVTHQLRLINLRAGADRSHDLPSIGEECVVFSPCGELGLGVVLCGLNNEDHPTISTNPNIKLRLFEDGALISYDTENHSLQAILPEGAEAIITANCRINGSLHVTDGITTDGDVKAGDISLRHHKTSKVKAGSDDSGEPIP